MDKINPYTSVYMSDIYDIERQLYRVSLVWMDGDEKTRDSEAKKMQGICAFVGELERRIRHEEATREMLRKEKEANDIGNAGAEKTE